MFIDVDRFHINCFDRGGKNKTRRGSHHGGINVKVASVLENDSHDPERFHRLISIENLDLLLADSAYSDEIEGMTIENLPRAA
jgi:hypothetical protein